MIDRNLKPLGDIASASISYQRTRVNLRDLLLDSTPKDMEGHVALIAELDKDLQKKLTVFEKSIKSEDVKREFESLKQSVAKFEPLKERIIKLSLDGKKDEAISLMRGEAFTVAKSTQEEIDKLFQMKIDNSDKESDQNTAETNSATKFLLSITGAGVLFAIIFGFFISKVISRPIRNLGFGSGQIGLRRCECQHRCDHKG